MPIIDMFIHPAGKEASLADLSALDWGRWCEEALIRMDENGVEASGVCIMDATGIILQPKVQDQIKEAIQTGRFWFTLMPQFRTDRITMDIELAHRMGFKGLTFHSYLQQIDPDSYDEITRLALFAQNLNMFTGICTAYGSKRIFEYHSLPLVARIAEEVEGPIVLYHNGGARVLEAMLLCEMWPQLYLETSFSLSYWVGSSVDKDLAFAIQKIGCGRVMFGSDDPFLPLPKALADHRDFFQRHGFTPAEQESILGLNARQFLNAFAKP